MEKDLNKTYSESFAKVHKYILRVKLKRKLLKMTE